MLLEQAIHSLYVAQMYAGLQIALYKFAKESGFCEIEA